jgi:hypothetical protein
MNPPNLDPPGQKNQVALSNESGVVPAWALSPEIWLMLRPAAAYQWLADSPDGKERWIAVRRPLFIAFLFGCMVSLVTSQRLTLRHVAGGGVNASFLLLGQIAALAIVCGRDRKISFSRTVDLFFAGYGPWTLWILVFSAVWAFTSTRHAFNFGGAGSILPTAGLVAIWSLYIDYRFFERVLQRSRARAVWDVMRLWAMCWSVSIVIFGWGTVWSEHMRMLDR